MSFATCSGFQPDSAICFVPTDELVRQVSRQQRWLVFMRNCAICQERRAVPAPQFRCGLAPEHCEFGQRLWTHMIAGCDDPRCGFPRCVDTRGLLKHFHSCDDVCCAVCAPVRSWTHK